MSAKPLQSKSSCVPGKVVLARVDNRLVHGQVLEAWIPFVRANGIVVASDEVAVKPLQKKLMAASIPSDTPVIIGTLSEIAEFFVRSEGATRILLLFSSSAAALQGHRLGIPFCELNLGNISSPCSQHRLSCSLSLNEEDLSNLRQLEDMGVRVSAQCLPSDEALDWKVLLSTRDE